MAVRWKECLYDTCWRHADAEILRAIERAYPRAIAEGMIGHEACIGHMLTHFQIRDSLCRLSEQGKIERVEYEQPVDLFEVMKVVAWKLRCPAAVAGGGDHGDR